MMWPLMYGSACINAKNTTIIAAAPRHPASRNAAIADTASTPYTHGT